MEFAVIGASRIKGQPSTLRPSSTIILTFFLVLAVATSQSVAQTVRLTAEQQQMLNQLPPAQRQQALQALEQLNRQGSDSTQQSSIAEELSPFPQADQLLSSEFLATLEEPEAQGGSRLIIDLNPKLDLSPQETTMLQDDAALQRIQGSLYYELDESGVLLLPGLSKIPLLGLTAEAIEQRLGAEPSLENFDVLVSILVEKPIGVDALEPFGYDVFESTSYGFEPVTTGPVPTDYVLGPGDSIRVQLFGNVNGIYEFEVTRDGILNLPEIGPVTVAGLPFSEFRADLNRRVQEMLIGTQTVSSSTGSALMCM